MVRSDTSSAPSVACNNDYPVSVMAMVVTEFGIRRRGTKRNIP